MIEVAQTITLTNDGSVWTLTHEEAKRLHLILGSLITPDRPPPPLQPSFEDMARVGWLQRASSNGSQS